MDRSDLPAGKYDAGSWQYMRHLPEDIERRELTLATFNVWFGDWFVQERYRAMLALLEHYRPDVIALQEVTLSALPIFLEQPWIRDAYMFPISMDTRWVITACYSYRVCHRARSSW